MEEVYLNLACSLLVTSSYVYESTRYLVYVPGICFFSFGVVVKGALPRCVRLYTRPLVSGGLKTGDVSHAVIVSSIIVLLLTY